jgi:hypothetical protein
LVTLSFLGESCEREFHARFSAVPFPHIPVDDTAVVFEDPVAESVPDCSLELVEVGLDGWELEPWSFRRLEVELSDHLDWLVQRGVPAGLVGGVLDKEGDGGAPSFEPGVVVDDDRLAGTLRREASGRPLGLWLTRHPYRD